MCAVFSSSSLHPSLIILLTLHNAIEQLSCGLSAYSKGRAAGQVLGVQSILKHWTNDIGILSAGEKRLFLPTGKSLGRGHGFGDEEKEEKRVEYKIPTHEFILRVTQ